MLAPICAYYIETKLKYSCLKQDNNNKSIKNIDLGDGGDKEGFRVRFVNSESVSHHKKQLINKFYPNRKLKIWPTVYMIF